MRAMRVLAKPLNEFALRVIGFPSSRRVIFFFLPACRFPSSVHKFISFSKGYNQVHPFQFLDDFFERYNLEIVPAMGFNVRNTFAFHAQGRGKASLSTIHCNG